MGMPRRPDQAFAPPSAPVAPGSQSGIFRGFLVVIFGSGSGKGLFVYNGTPGAGNLVASITAASGMDPYGNAYQSQVTVYDPALTKQFIQLIGNTGGVQQSFATGITSESAPGRLFAEAVNRGGANERAQISMFSPGSTSGLDSVVVQLIGSAANNAGIATGFVDYIDTAGANHEIASWSADGFGSSLVAAPLIPVQPGTSGPTLASETWHSLGTLANYVVNVAQYRMTTEGELEIRVSVGSGGANAASTNFSVTLPAAYQITGSLAQPMAMTVGTWSTAAPPYILVNGGTVSVVQAAAVTATIQGRWIWPLS